MSMKIPQTPAGIEPASFRFVAQHLNHCATAVPNSFSTNVKFYRISSIKLGAYARKPTEGQTILHRPFNVCT